MAMKKFKLIEKTKLTHDVYHMNFQIDDKLNIQPGQFITFILPKLWGRAYSILVENNDNIELIIKKVENWRWGSIYICDSEIWEILNWVWPAWKFLIKENNKNKMFLWTWTGLVPLYNQIIYSLANNSEIKIKLLFWVRFEKDLFYIDKLNKLREKYSNFDFEIYLSREKIKQYNKWYVTNYFKENSLSFFWEFYICWMPDMVDSVSNELEKKEIKKENIFSEKY